MSIVIALDEVKPEQANKANPAKNGSPGSVSTTFFRATADKPHAPTAALNRYPAGESRYSAAHFHQVDQFQVIMEGSGTFGRHEVQPYCVHFSRAYTPYGPLQSEKETGWGFIVMRTRFDPGAQRFPQSYEKLKKVPDRRPWQVTKKVSFPQAGAGMSLQDVPEIKDDQGLFTKTLTMAANAQAVAPDPSGGDGQYVVAVKGSLMHDGKERQAPAVIFIEPSEPAFKLLAGAEGLQAIVMNFPKATPRDVDTHAPSVATGFKKWQCELCAFYYDEALGMPNEGVPAGTRWADVPDTWTCPDCAAGKSDFQMIEVQ